MTTSHTLLSTLENEFKNNETKSHCLNNSKKYLDANNVTRIFDPFPQLLPQKEFAILQNSLKKFLSQIKEVKQTDEGFQLVEKNDFENISALQKLIIKTGCDELFKDGNINIQLIKLLDWQEHASQIKHRDLLCAYVGAVNMQLINSLSDFIYENMNQFTATCDYVNKHYHQWVIEGLKQSSLTDDSKSDNTKIEIFRLPTKKVAATTAVIIGITAIAYCAAKSLYQFFNQEKPTTEIPDEKNSSSPNTSVEKSKTEKQNTKH